jgi:hypothetical protein
MASFEIVLSRLQARERPVAQDRAAIDSDDDEDDKDFGRGLPDGANAPVS